MPTLPPVQAAIYCRISDDRLDGDRRGLGVARQEADCRALCERKGWADPILFVDNDVSATSGAPRPAYQELLAAIQAGHVNAVAVWDVDRLTRKVRDLEDLIELFDRYRVQLASVGGEIDLATEQGRLVARIKGAVARHEAEAMSRRIRRKMLQNALDGLPGPGSVRPFGFEADKVTHRPSEVALVREAVADVISGVSLRSIVLDWRDRGITSTHGNPWTIQALRYMLISGRIAGLRDHHRAPVGPAVWDPIITAEERAALLHILGDRARLTTPSRARKHLLVGWLWCGRCGARMRTNNRTRKNARGERTSSLAYACKDRTVGGCGGIAVQKAWLDELVTDAVLRRAVRVGRSGRSEERAAEKRSRAVARVAALEGRLTDLGREYAAADTPGLATALRAAVAVVEEELAAARRDATPPARPVGEGPVTLRDLRARWAGLSLLEQREIVAAYVERIEIGPAAGAVRRSTPDRVTITWR